MRIKDLETRLTYAFRRTDLLEEACRHSSYVNEHPAEGLRDNERLEFLGDAVLNLIIGHQLMEQYPELPEGNLSRLRAALVNEARLADIARSIDLGRFIKLGKGERLTDGHDKNSILADAFEAVIAAVYLDGGFDAARETARRHFRAHLSGVAAQNADQDYKTRLQERVQATLKAAPVYEIAREYGPDHDKTFVVSLRIGDLETAGTGKNKKAAEQDAARNALDALGASP